LKPAATNTLVSITMPSMRPPQVQFYFGKHVGREKRRPIWPRRCPVHLRLCARPLSAADCLAIAERFAATILEAIPRLDTARHNEARPFNVLIDILYEARIC
jgi:AFG1-like ATPase